MVVLARREILKYVEEGRLVIEPFSKEIVRENGLDLRVGNEYAKFDNKLVKRLNIIVDSKSIENITGVLTIIRTSDGILINPNERVLLTTLEYIKMPEDLVGFCCLRSTFARLGLFIPPTIIDAGFEGRLVIELIGSTIPVRLHVGDRFLHVVLVKTSSPTKYMGKYQKQKGIIILGD